ncbi:MAG: GMC family oxidoreductase N-terminal domain-containing protein [Microthrixaceae bacterium]
MAAARHTLQGLWDAVVPGTHAGMIQDARADGTPVPGAGQAGVQEWFESIMGTLPPPLDHLADWFFRAWAADLDLWADTFHLPVDGGPSFGDLPLGPTFAERGRQYKVMLMMKLFPGAIELKYLVVAAGEARLLRRLPRRDHRSPAGGRAADRLPGARGRAPADLHLQPALRHRGGADGHQPRRTALRAMSTSVDLCVLGSGFGAGPAAARRRVRPQRRGRRGGAPLGRACGSAEFQQRQGDLEYYLDLFRADAGFDAAANGASIVVGGRGLGGGSLVYSMVSLRAPSFVFEDPVWPAEVDRAELDPYYRRAEQQLGVVQLQWEGDRPTDDWKLSGKRDAAFASLCETAGVSCDPVPVAINNDCANLGWCTTGCVRHGKNSVDLRYMQPAEDLGAEMRVGTPPSAPPRPVRRTRGVGRSTPPRGRRLARGDLRRLGRLRGRCGGFGGPAAAFGGSAPARRLGPGRQEPLAWWRRDDPRGAAGGLRARRDGDAAGQDHRILFVPLPLRTASGVRG